MGVQVIVIRDRKVVVRIPVFSPGPQQEGLYEEVSTRSEELSQVIATAANGKRFRLLVELLKHPESRFTDLLPVAVNPKLLRDSIVPMTENGLVVQGSPRAPYVLTNKGVIVATILTRGMADLLRAVEKGDL